MNRKLHNALLGLTSSAGALALCLALAVPAPKHQPESVALQLGPVDFTFTPSHAGRPRAEQAQALMLSAQKRAEQVDTLAQAASLAAEVAAAAALASAYDAGAYEATASDEERKQARTASRHRRQTLVMPYFSFAPRG